MNIVFVFRVPLTADEIQTKYIGNGKSEESSASH